MSYTRAGRLSQSRGGGDALDPPPHHCGPTRAPAARRLRALPRSLVGDRASQLVHCQRVDLRRGSGPESWRVSLPFRSRPAVAAIRGSLPLTGRPVQFQIGGLAPVIACEVRRGLVGTQVAAVPEDPAPCAAAVLGTANDARANLPRVFAPTPSSLTRFHRSLSDWFRHRRVGPLQFVTTTSVSPSRSRSPVARPRLTRGSTRPMPRRP